MRVAIFFAPAPEHPLSEVAAAWLMRDAFTGACFDPLADIALSPDELRSVTADPRRYGFHATLKAPFRLAPGFALDDLRGAVGAFTRGSERHKIASIRLERLGSFFALTPGDADAALDALAADIVKQFDAFRAPLTGEEIARRRPEALTPSELRNLEAWGYPYVLEDFRFHMSLTGPVVADRRGVVAETLERRFAPFLGRPLTIDALTLFVEPEPGADFHVAARYPFGDDGFVPMLP